jgi:hypothetical protein
MELLADRDPEEARQLLDPMLERLHWIDHEAVAGWRMMSTSYSEMYRWGRADWRASEH